MPGSVIAAVVTALALAALNIYLGVGYLKIEAFWNRWRGANFVEPEWKLPGWIEHKKDYPTRGCWTPIRTCNDAPSYLHWGGLFSFLLAGLLIVAAVVTLLRRTNGILLAGAILALIAGTVMALIIIPAWTLPQIVLALVVIALLLLPASRRFGTANRRETKYG